MTTTATAHVGPNPTQLNRATRPPKWCTVFLAVAVLAMLASLTWVLVGFVERNTASKSAAHAQHDLAASQAASDTADQQLSAAQFDAELMSGDAHRILDLSQRQLDLAAQDSALTRQSIQAFAQDNASRYNALTKQINALVDQFNATVDEINNLINEDVAGAL